jgi:hypothetical protein
LSAHQLRLNFALKAPDHSQVASHQQAISDTAANLQQIRGRQVFEVHQQAWRNAEEVDAAIGLQGQQRIDMQRTLPDDDRIADARIERRGETFVDPDRARSGYANGRCVGDVQRRRNAQGAAQRVSGANRLDLRQLRPQLVTLAARYHARKSTRLDDLQATRLRLPGQLFRPGMVGGQQQIGTKQLVGLAVESLTHAVGEESDRRQCCDGNHQRRREQAQLTATGITAQHSPGKGQHL